MSVVETQILSAIERIVEREGLGAAWGAAPGLTAADNLPLQVDPHRYLPGRRSMLVSDLFVDVSGSRLDDDADQVVPNGTITTFDRSG